MRRRWLAIITTAAAATGCTAEGTGPQPAASTVVTPMQVPSPPVSKPATYPTVPLSSADPVATSLTPGPGSPIVVEGGPLARAVVDAILRRGGETVDSSAWDARFETYGLPHVVGDGVLLVEATVDATRVTNGWRRADQLQWLFLDTSHNGIGSLLDQAAVAAGLSGWAIAETAEVVERAECTKRIYTAPSGLASPVWTLQGCAFPTFAGMYSLGVGRDGVFAGAHAPIVEPTVGLVAAALGGTVDEVHVAFGHPEATGSATTLRISVQVSFNADVNAALAALGGGPLVGWQQFPGDSSVMLSGTGGASWGLSDGSARFSFEGRLQS